MTSAGVSGANLTVSLTISNEGGCQFFILGANGARVGDTVLISPRNSGLPFSAYFQALGVHAESQVKVMFCNNTGAVLNLHNFDLHVMTFR